MNFNKYLELEGIKKELEELREELEACNIEREDYKKYSKQLEEENKVLINEIVKLKNLKDLLEADEDDFIFENKGHC